MRNSKKVSLSVGQPVFRDVTTRGRDDPDAQILFGIHGGGYPAAQKLMEDGGTRLGLSTRSSYSKISTPSTNPSSVLVYRTVPQN